MAYGATGAGASAAYAAMVNAVRASGAIVEVEPEVFEQLVGKTKEPLVIYAEPGFMSKKSSYLTNHRGFFFHTKTERRLNLPSQCEMIKSKKIWVPN